MLLLDVLKANSPLLAVTDGWRDVNGTKFVTVLLCWSLRLISSFICCRKRGLITGIETGGGERIMKHYVPLLISAMILGHPNVCEFLWPENWKTCSWRLFPYKRTRLLKKKKKGAGEWIILDCYFEYTEMKSDFCICLCTDEEMSRMSSALSSQNAISIQSPQWVNIIQIPTAGACALGLAQSTIVKWSFLSVMILPPLYLCFPSSVSFFRAQCCPCKYWVRKTPYGSEFSYILLSKKNQNKGAP